MDGEEDAVDEGERHKGRCFVEELEKEKKKRGEEEKVRGCWLWRREERDERKQEWIKWIEMKIV